MRHEIGAGSRGIRENFITDKFQLTGKKDVGVNLT